MYKEVHNKTQANDVYYLLIINVCRETPQESAVGFSGTLDPVYRDAVGEEAMRWALCAGISSGSPAARCRYVRCIASGCVDKLCD